MQGEPKRIQNNQKTPRLTENQGGEREANKPSRSSELAALNQDQSNTDITMSCSGGNQVSLPAYLDWSIRSTVPYSTLNLS